MFELFSYGFIWIGILAGLLIAISSALVSPFLVFNNKSLIADGLSHVAFTGVAIGLSLFNQPLYVAIPFTICLSLVINFISQKERISGDIAIGLISSVSLAIGLVVISFSKGFNVSINSVLFGSLFAISLTDLIVLGITTILIIVFICFNYHQLLAITFDESYAKSKKMKVSLLSYTLSALVGILVIVGVKTIGVLLISALVVFPAVIVSLFKNNFKATLIYGVGISSITIFFGIFFAHHLNVNAGAIIVILFANIGLFTYLFGLIKRRVF